MHFYPFNIGDYASATAHLEPLEDLAYRRLMDLYYSTEKPIPLDLDKAARLIRMRTHSDCIAVVLDDFFTKEDDGFHCDRIDVELFKFQEKSEKASQSAKVRWKKAKKNQKVKASCERIANAVETQSEGNANQEPRTNKQEPVTKKANIDYSAVTEVYNRSLTNASNIAKMTDDRKKLVKKFFDAFEFNIEKFESYISYINDHADCQWMFEKRPKNDGTGRNWAPLKFEYFISEKCYLNIKENL